MRRGMGYTILGLMTVFLLSGCGQKSENGGEWNNKGNITVIAHEDDTILHEDFEEIFEIGEEVSGGAHIAEDPAEIRSMVARNEYAVGYIPKEELNDTVKAVSVEDMDADITVIVNHKNMNDQMTKEQIEAIFTGELSAWNEVLTVQD